MKAVQVPLSSILTELEATSTQVRLAHDSETIAEYAGAMKRRAQFPPVSLVRHGTRYYIADGWHRVLAAKRIEAKAIPAYILPSMEGLAPLASALRYALRSNCAHGLRLTPGDQRNKARRALQELPGMVDLGDRAIGREIGVSHQTVSRARAELVRERLIPHSVTGEVLDPIVPDEYGGAQAFKAAFGEGELFDQVLGYLRQLNAKDPKDWTFDGDEGRVIHRGLIPDTAVAFDIEDNPVVSGLPRDWEAVEEPEEEPYKPMEQEQRDMLERMNARRQFREALERIKATKRADLIQAANTIAKYRNVPGLGEDLRALVGAFGPPQEHTAGDF